MKLPAWECERAVDMLGCELNEWWLLHRQDPVASFEAEHQCIQAANALNNEAKYRAALEKILQKNPCTCEQDDRSLPTMPECRYCNGDINIAREALHPKGNGEEGK